MIHSELPYNINNISKGYSAPPTVIIILGASGDLSSRKLLPSIFNLKYLNLLPECLRLIGFGRKHLTKKKFQKNLFFNISKSHDDYIHNCRFRDLYRNTYYYQSDYSDLKNYFLIFDHIKRWEREINRSVQIIFYVSTPPSLLNSIAENLGLSDLSNHNSNKREFSKIIIEKPFGDDLESSQHINANVEKYFEKYQIFRIDHYLGKEGVRGMMIKRFSNSILEPIWNYNYIDSIQITVSESIGIGDRAGYYDNSGALRDMIQNHIMQLICCVAIEPPASLSPQNVKDEKIKLLGCIRPIDVRLDAVRAQYVGGLASVGYLDEKEINPGSLTETYISLRLNIDNERWRGVPFYIRSGKRMPRKLITAIIQLKHPLHFSSRNFKYNKIYGSNQILFQIHPDKGLSFAINSKIPGFITKIDKIQLNNQTCDSNTDSMIDYEKLILDVIHNDSTLFVGNDENELSWQLYTPLLKFWKSAKSKDLCKYHAGSWGPKESDNLLIRNNHKWNNLSESNKNI